MEQQFVLRLPESLQNIDLSMASLSKISDTEVQLVYDGVTHRGVVCRLPTIVETQQLIENKLFKVADISTIIVILPSNWQGDPTEMIREVEKSGITPPMSHISERRLRSTGVKAEIYEKVEQKVTELLREDARAISVELLDEEASIDNELDMFAASIENELPVNKHEVAIPERIISLENEDSETPRRIVPQPVASKPSALPASEPQATSLLSSPQAVELTAGPQRQPSQELIDIEEKIRERREILEKAVNPILKKRFAQRLEQLEKEREEILKKTGM